MLYTTAYNSYWEKYGERFENACKALESKPDRIVVISDEPVSTSYENIILKHNSNDIYGLGKYRQKAYESCDCDWLVQIDIDDVMYPNYLNNLNEHVDWHIFHMKNNDGIMFRLNDWWEDFFSLDNIPFGGLMNSAFKLKALQKINGFTVDVGWEDLITICNLRFNDCTIFSDKDVIRGERILSNSGSITSDAKMAAAKANETQKYKEKLGKLYNERES